MKLLPCLTEYFHFRFGGGKSELMDEKTGDESNIQALIVTLFEYATVQYTVRRNADNPAGAEIAAAFLDSAYYLSPVSLLLALDSKYPSSNITLRLV